jgi:hypothetical protein
MANEVEFPSHEAPRIIAERYRLEALLGRGGMASVYRATDLASGRELALKQLTAAVEPDAPKQVRVAAALFEREFQTLVQLRHPRVIEVYDYGLADLRPYYTMELLDGGDLRDSAPMPWRRACSLLFDVCSSLALLHSRRLLHRDISPRNIRCTRDGKAKLIDFGAMAPMTTGGAEAVGTPSFIAPETLHRLALDARTDLFSLGATLYFALTRQLAYPARGFAEVMTVWKEGAVTPPSAFAPEIPAALDDLVLSLINLEPALRPQTAFEVMQRLAACAGLQGSESDAVSRAYLATPLLIGRETARDIARTKLLDLRAAASRGLLFTGAPGVGRSRLLDACVLDAKALGFAVLRATASNRREPFGCMRALTEHLMQTHRALAEDEESSWLYAVPPPSATGGAQHILRSFADSSVDPEHLQRTLCRLLQRASGATPLLLAVDDVHRIDPQSAAVLAAALDQTTRGRIALALTSDSEDSGSAALSALSRRCDHVALEPLSRTQTERLFGSLFGDVAHVPLLAHEIYQVALGNPRQCMDMAQHLVERGLIRYAAGTWNLPAKLGADDLPRSAADAMRARVERLSPEARWLAEAHALAFDDAFTDQDYRELAPELSSHTIESALSELLRAHALVSDGATYVLANRLWKAALIARLDADQVRARNRALASFYEPRSRLANIHHSFGAGLYEEGLDAMIAQHQSYERGFDYRRDPSPGKLRWCSQLALTTAQRLGRSPRQIHDLRRWHLAGSISDEHGEWDESARLWFEQLAHDSGLDLYRSDSESLDSNARLMRALQAAQQRFLATPEHERVYPVDQAIRLLAEYVVYCIALGGRTHDAALLQSLPAILEPFAALSPALSVIWKNARAAHLINCARYESARELWIEVLAQLDSMDSHEMQHVAAIANAVAFAIGMLEARLGLASATRWATRMESDPFQKIAALNLRRIVSLEQGDWEAADRTRRQAEVLSLQMRSPQMFRSMLAVELSACARAMDLAGLQQGIEAVRPLAEAYQGWRPYLIAAEGNFDLVRGDYEAAKIKFEHCIDLTRFDVRGFSPSASMWITAQWGLSEALIELGRPGEARERAGAALGVCSERGITDRALELERVLAVAEAELGDLRAAARLEAMIAHQTQLGVTGLRLGLTYEARARVAILSADADAFERYARLTARAYRHGAHSPLAARYERLMNEASRRGLGTTTQLRDLERASASSVRLTTSDDDLQTQVERTMTAAHSVDERGQLALQLICDAVQATCGHLYLTTADGLTPAASYRTGPADSGFSARLSEIYTAMCDRTDHAPTQLEYEDQVYELLVLRTEGELGANMAGLAAVITTHPPRASELARALGAVAAHIIRTKPATQQAK